MAAIQPHDSDQILAVFDDHEAQLLRRVVADIQELLARRAQSGETARPQDPAVVRLFPDAYLDDPEAAQELRQLTEESLRQSKSESAAAVLATLPEQGGEVVLDPESAQAWLTALNDIRLVLGVRLNVTDETHAEMEAQLAAVGEDIEHDSELGAYVVYQWISALQEELVVAVSSSLN